MSLAAAAGLIDLTRLEFRFECYNLKFREDFWRLPIEIKRNLDPKKLISQNSDLKASP